MIIRLAQESLKQAISRRFPMLSRIQLLKFAAAGGVVACTLGTPARPEFGTGWASRGHSNRGWQ